jgi:Mn-dependent DtxR family transcriptional regulator
LSAIDHVGVHLSIESPSPTFTAKQGQYLAFIYAYAIIHGRPPAQRDMERFFGVSPPSVHRMVLQLAQLGLIRRTPGAARSLELTVAPEALPLLRAPK